MVSRHVALAGAVGVLGLMTIVTAGPVASTPNPVPPPGFTISVAIGGHGELTTPTAMAFAPDGRMFVAERAGLIKVFSGSGDTTPTTFADLRTEVNSAPGRGLLNIALDPQFPTRPYVYALYSRDSKTRGGPVPGWNDTCANTTDGCVTWSRLVRLTASGDVATGKPRVLLDDWCDQNGHAVGTLVFGPDKVLYVGGGDGATPSTADYGQFGTPGNPCGDPPGGTALTPPTTEGGALRAQDVTTDADPAGLDGTIIRIYPNNGAPVAGNPFITSPDVNKQRIIAYGLRNPFRSVFLPGTSQLWISDPGWDTYDEINRIRNVRDNVAENFGWPCYEGALPQPTWQSLNTNLCNSLYSAGTAIKPTFTYAQASKIVPNESCPIGASAPTGIAFYQGTNYPSSFRGGLFFTDYSRKCIWFVPPNASGSPVFANRQTFANIAPAAVTDIKAGPEGDLYLVDIGGGQILHLQYVGG